MRQLLGLLGLVALGFGLGTVAPNEVQQYGPFIGRCVKFVVPFVFKLLELILSWPMAIFALGFLFLLLFEEPISHYIREHLGGVKASASGLEIQERQHRIDGESDVEPEMLRMVIDEFEEKLRQTEQVVEMKGQAERDRILQAAREVIQEENQKTTFWYDRFLALFLVPKSQILLRWIVLDQSAVVSREHLIPVANMLQMPHDELDSTLGILVEYYLLKESTQGSYQATENAIRFVRNIPTSN